MASISNKTYTVNSNYSNKIASTVGWAGHKLTYLTSFMIEQGAKVCRPIKPGFQDQCQTRFKEICYRIFRVFLCIMLSWGLLLGLVGSCMRLASSLARRNFTLIKPTENLIFENRVVLCM